MFGHCRLGLEIGPQGLTAVAAKRRGRQTVLIDGQVMSLDRDLIRPDFNQPNVNQPEAFVKALQQLLRPLYRRDNRIAVSLPDAAGQVFLLTVEAPFKSRSEGAEIIRWQLQDQLPQTNGKVALDFQILGTTEAGHKKVLVAALQPQVLKQYEALIEQAGYAAALIDFHSFSLYNAYQGTLDMGRDFVFVAVAGRQLTLLAMTNRLPTTYRCRSIAPDPGALFQELNRSLVKLRQRADFGRLPVHLHADWPPETVMEAVAGAFEQEVQWLQTPISYSTNRGKQTLSTADSYLLVAAYGACERLLLGGNR